MTRRDDDFPLYPSEAQIARKVLGDRARDWPSVAAHDERSGLPKIDPVHGGRYWPKVKYFYDRLNDLDDRARVAGPSSSHRVRIIDTAPHGQEDFRGEKDAAIRGRRNHRRAIGQRI